MSIVSVIVVEGVGFSIKQPVMALNVRQLKVYRGVENKKLYNLKQREGMNQ